MVHTGGSVFRCYHGIYREARVQPPHIAPNPNTVASLEITSAWSAKNMTFEDVPRKKCWWYWVKGVCAKGEACAFVHG